MGASMQRDCTIGDLIFAFILPTLPNDKRCGIIGFQLRIYEMRAEVRITGHLISAACALTALAGPISRVLQKLLLRRSGA